MAELPTKEISELPAAVALADSDVLVGVQDGVTKKFPGSLIGGAGTWEAAGTAAALISQHNHGAGAHPELSAAISADADRAEAAAEAAQAAVSVYRVFASETDMNADLGASAGQLAIVTGSADWIWFYKIGAPGGGSWAEVDNQPVSDATLARALARETNKLTGTGDLSIDTTTGQLLAFLRSDSPEALVILQGLSEKMRLDTQRNRLVLGVELERTVDVMAVSEGHVDRRSYPETQVLASGEPDALLWLTELGETALRFDTSKKQVTSEFTFESGLERRPPTVFVDVPPRIERDLNDPAYTLADRVYQATPTIARTGPNRYWTAWRADNTNAAEGPGNFSVLGYSDDGGVTVQEYGYLTYSPLHPDKHMVDPMLWLDPDGRLWLFYGVQGNNEHFDGVQGSWAIICQNPNAEFPVWGQGFRLSYFGDPRHPVQVNGEWYIAIDGWRFDAQYPPLYRTHDGPHIYKLDWRRQRVEHISQLPPNNGSQYSGFFETEFVQRSDGSVLATCRWTAGASGVLRSVSTDLMRTWSPWVDYSELAPASSSRIWLGRTPSGRMLVCWNNDTIRRTLTLGLSDDDGTTFPYRVLVEPDQGIQVSYPVVGFGDSGEILAIYDVGRIAEKQIRIAKMVEQDIVAGTSVPIVSIVSDPANP